MYFVILHDTKAIYPYVSETELPYYINSVEECLRKGLSWYVLKERVDVAFGGYKWTGRSPAVAQSGVLGTVLGL